LTDYVLPAEMLGVTRNALCKSAKASAMYRDPANGDHLFKRSDQDRLLKKTAKFIKPT